MNDEYARTVQLLLAVAPSVFESAVFAMKGGTALNLFVQDMPRLSVDIDVVFLPHEMNREEALQAIGKELAAAKARLEKLGLEATLRKTRDGNDAKMFVSGDGVEVNFVFRGTVLPPVLVGLTAAAQEKFSANIEVPVLATPELYGSKLVAALDRQHPRDLFDVQLMFSRFGLPEQFLDCFVVYLAGHDRPVHEVLFPTSRSPTWSRAGCTVISANGSACGTCSTRRHDRSHLVRGNFSEFVDSSMRMGSSDLRTKHLIGTPVVTLSGDKAVVETNAMIAGENVRIDLGCSVHNRFFDLAEKRDGRWKLLKRQSVYDMGTFTFPQGLVGIDHAVVKRYPGEHAPLAYVLEKSGFTVERVFATRGSGLDKSMKVDANAWLAA